MVNLKMLHTTLFHLYTLGMKKWQRKISCQEVGDRRRKKVAVTNKGQIEKFLQWDCSVS